ncbi:MAG TPA: Mur ligase family protein, partial [Candidatus Limnocylindrales bacterium]|nr:Mur ligase family protein [Candidatus Limnocylindrales bacterium]
LAYESNEASVLTNISADHLDLQGLHTLPELAEVKSVICRVTRPSGTVVLNADDALLVPIARRVRAAVTFFSLNPRSARIRSHVARGGNAFVLDDGWIVELAGSKRRRIVATAELPATLGGLAKHNVANALAAAAGARAIGLSYRAIADGLRGFRNTADLMPGRLNLYRKDDRLVVVDYAHNEAGLAALFDTIEGLVGKRDKRRATVSVIIGAAGDRPDDAMRAVGQLAARRADDVAIKEDLPFLRGRTRASAIGELREGIRAGGTNPTSVPVYELELDGLVGELTTPGRLAATDDGTPRVVMLMCHAERDAVASFLADEGFVEVHDIRALEGFRPKSG